MTLNIMHQHGADFFCRVVVDAKRQDGLHPFCVNQQIGFHGCYIWINVGFRSQNAAHGRQGGGGP